MPIACEPGHVDEEPVATLTLSELYLIGNKLDPWRDHAISDATDGHPGQSLLWSQAVQLMKSD